MNEVWWVPISVAAIGGPLMWLLQRLDRRNTEQHGENQRVLERIEEKVDDVKSDLSDHFKWHTEHQEGQ